MTPVPGNRATSSIVVFTRDLRIRDQPALTDAIRGADHVVPVFVFDDAILAAGFSCPNRIAFLIESLEDLDRSLQRLGGGLVVRRGDWVREVVALVAATGAGRVHVSDDVSGFARRRYERLETALGPMGVALHRAPGTTIVPAGAVVPDRRDHYAVFTPYHRRWLGAPWRSIESTPRAITLPAGLDPGAIPKLDTGAKGERAISLARGGETEARSRLSRWTRSHLAEYSDRHDDLAGDATSRLSPYVHFGCISPLEVATKLRSRPGGGEYVRQLCWRDFFHQILAARPDAAWSDYRSGSRWDEDEDALTAWRDGLTGYPLVDAGMRQLRHEGFMHNRARLVVASFLTKHLRLDWRHGARHFLDHLVDGDLASNNLSWQWVAGTGTDTNPHRIFNPTRQGHRFDPRGDYVRRYVPELASIEGADVHDPAPFDRAACGYRPPIVDHHVAVAEYRARAAAPA